MSFYFYTSYPLHILNLVFLNHLYGRSQNKQAPHKMSNFVLL